MDLNFLFIYIYFTILSSLCFCEHANTDDIKDNISPSFWDYLPNSSLNRFKRASTFSKLPSLMNEPGCKDDIKRLCGFLKPNTDDLTVLECIELAKVDVSTISETCHHVLWTHTRDLFEDDHLRSLVDSSCRQDWEQIEESTNCNPRSRNQHSQNLLSCMIDNAVNDKISTQCQHMIQRVELVAFSDFRIVAPFADYCNSDIQKLKCGRIAEKNEMLSQGATLACLQQQVDKLTELCQYQVLRLSSLQAENIKFDRQLFLACTDERTRFCPNIVLGSGQVYRCLMQHKMDNSISQQCHEQLSRHQKLISQEYSISKGLARACKEDIRTYRCRRLVSDDKGVRLAQILLCLENVMKNGTKLISRDCQTEMIEHRKLLMEDYRLSPEIVSRCSDDITKYCTGLEAGGKTIHCLMEHSRPKRRKNRVSPPCQRALEMLIKEADVGEDWRVDPVLREACEPVVNVACQDARGGDARVMSCLMEKLGTRSMTEACETALLQIQYFVARDYKLDPQLYRACHDDAVKYCHAKKAWHDQYTMDPERGPLVLPCLFRFIYETKDRYKLKKECTEEVRRVMRQRAVSVELQPEVERMCLDDLATFCFEKTGKGEEMICLQDNLEKLQAVCRSVVSNYTELQSENLDLNPVITSVCKTVMEKHCESELNSENGVDVIECLIDHKNDPDVRANYKCRAAIEHHQLISLKDYHFTLKFKDACRTHVTRFCPTARTKGEVVKCLSLVVRNDTILDKRHSIPKDCRQQLKAQLFQQRENIDFDPDLKKLCMEDIKTHCPTVPHGAAQVLECLENAKSRLTAPCHRYIFSVEKQDLTDSSSDYLLITTCKQMIKQFCRSDDVSQALSCLKEFKDEATFDPKCKLVVVRRMIDQSSDYRFNPALMRGCHPDIAKFCSHIVSKQTDGRELEGQVVNCLKKQFREQNLREECEKQMTVVLKEAALNYKLNPLLRNLCIDDIQKHCSSVEDGRGAVEECLKVALIKGIITERACKLEVAGLIEESKADIHVDPLLYGACALDINKFCTEIPKGAGRIIHCLMAALERPKIKLLQTECQTMLQQRIEMFKNADKLVGSPRNIEELATQISISPFKRYFMVVGFSIVGMVFITGMFCGRVTRRTILMKNK